jgi:hypothetical protein
MDGQDYIFRGLGIRKRHGKQWCYVPLWTLFKQTATNKGDNDSALQQVEECFWVSLTCYVYYHISCYQHKSFVVVFYVLVFAVVVQMAKWQGACSKESSAQCREEAHTTNVL